MTATQQKLTEAFIMLAQARAASNDYVVFIANLNAFVSAARSVTLVMQTEFNSVPGFSEWYELQQQEMKKHGEFDFFNSLRVDTVHVRPFNASSNYTVTFAGGLTVSGGTKVEIPLGRVDDRGNIVAADKEPVIIDGSPVHGIERSTSRTYCFSDRPQEDAVTLCEEYVKKVAGIVADCHHKFPGTLGVRPLSIEEC